jgi:UDP-N-acetylmuramyl-tripeptide synthetase
MVVLHTPEQALQWLRQHVTGTLHTDSRAIAPGDGFVAWPGSAVDARRFVPSALQQGAVACLVEQQGSEAWMLPADAVAHYPSLQSQVGTLAAEWFGHPSRTLATIAVTGTNGKTSTTWWLAHALSQLDAADAMPCGMVGTLGIGLPGQALVSTGLTTPDPVMLQRSLRQWLDQGLKACAMEASSIGLEECRLQGLQIRVAVFTNFSQDHLDYHGSMEAYWQAKRRLFDWPGLHSAVINVDDAYGMALADSLQGRLPDLWTVSCQREARLQACNVSHHAEGMRFDVREGAVTLPLSTRMLGAYNVSNILGVVAAMRALGVPLASAVQACSQLLPVPGRMECVGGEGEPLVALDYAHSPDALAHALDALRPIVQQRGGRLWCVFGCGGDRDTSKRPMMGAIAMRHADAVVITSDNPRTEKPESIISHILLGLVEQNAAEVCVDRAQAIAQAIAQAAPEDVILLAGKGHETTQEIAGVKHPFSDRAQALHALDATKKTRGVSA